MMKPGRFFWKLFLGNVLLMVLVLGASVWLIVREVESAARENLTHRLLAQAVTIRHAVEKHFDGIHRLDLRAVARELGQLKQADIRVTMVAVDGTVWADSEAEPETMASHGDRPEIKQALSGGWGHAERRSETLKCDMKYVAVRVDNAEGVALGTVRVAMPVRGITAQTSTMTRLIWQTAAVGLGAACLIALGLAYVWSSPIQRITETARSLSRGDLSARTEVHGGDEIAQMARSLNQMRESIAGQLSTIERQRKNLEYLIRSLTEGVIVAGSSGRIVLMNEAACRLLGTMPSGEPESLGRTGLLRDEAKVNLDLLVGRNVRDCITQPQLAEFLSEENKARPDDNAGEGSSGGQAVKEFRLQVEHRTGAVHLLARCSRIGLPSMANGDATDSVGRMVVLTNITELTRTIRMKTDFVANASHELRTPLSTIRASVETLEQMNLSDDADAAANFIRVIGKHTNRLEELVNDLLHLSRLESAAAEFHPEALRLDELLDDLYTRFSHSIKSKGLVWDLQCSESSRDIFANGKLLRLVLDNLVANAIKFTDPSGHIWISCARLGKSISIEVRDDGCGIPKEDQDRVFERFYQVERARSGAGRNHPGERGTGLGLSIVRHAVAAMSGTILLKSQPGKGTSVTLFVPQPA